MDEEDLTPDNYLQGARRQPGTGSILDREQERGREMLEVLAEAGIIQEIERQAIRMRREMRKRRLMERYKKGSKSKTHFIVNEINKK